MNLLRLMFNCDSFSYHNVSLCLNSFCSSCLCFILLSILCFETYAFCWSFVNYYHWNFACVFCKWVWFFGVVSLFYYGGSLRCKYYCLSWSIFKFFYLSSFVLKYTTVFIAICFPCLACVFVFISCWCVRVSHGF